jgi:predicted DNA-binding ribbon-helix-helix protein
MTDPESTKPKPDPRPNRNPAAAGVARVGRSLTVNGRAVTVRLEPPVWQAFDEVCQRQGRTSDELLVVIDRQRGDVGLAASIRAFLTRYFREAADRDRPHRGMAESSGESPPLSSRLSAALDSIGPPPKRPK